MFSKRDVVLAQEYMGFLLLNMFDLFLTGWIFRHSGQEANGIANWVLHHKGWWWGLRGFAIYKFIMVFVLILTCEVIAMYNVQKARLVILGGCALYVLVVLWECFLIFTVIDTPQVQPAKSSSTSIHLRLPPIIHSTRLFV